MTDKISELAPRRTVRAPVAQKGRRVAKRREQQRSIDTRRVILEAALAEFAEKGFEGASTRGIGARAGLQHPLITYHFRTKQILWRAVATHFHTEIKRLWDQHIPRDPGLPALDRVREEFRTFLRFTIQHPHFHQFMLNENRPDSPRLAWLAKHILGRNIRRVLPQIQAAQQAGDLPAAEPVLIHYMLIGMTSVLTSLAPEIRTFSRISPDDSSVVERYWELIESFIFSRKGAFRADPTASAPAP
jgi:TetR/AcrR family transcriptional regulator